MENKFKKGDEVKCRDDLIPHNVYGGLTLWEHMYFSKTKVINFINKTGHIELVGTSLVYAPEMLELVSSDKSEDIRHFNTGSVRDTAEGKPRMGLLPWDLLRRVAVLYTKGAEKYEADNWRKGQPKDTTMDSLTRHLEAYRHGETDEDHLSAVIWNALSMMNVDEYLLRGHPELDFKVKYPKRYTVEDVISKALDRYKEEK